MQESMTVVRSALYVDFDNVYLGLQQTDAAAAEGFATNPGRWLSRLEAGGVRDGLSYRRRFLIRACYLNPTSFARYRGDFARAGFRVVDCPSLTRQGKSGADIQLALDVVDALSHPTRYDEFIICSADADFTPLMVKLRSHDRRTVMVAASPVSSAYEAMCDDVLGPAELADAVLTPEQPAFVEAAPTIELTSETPGSTGSETPRPEQPDTASVVSAIIAAVAESPVPVPGASAAHIARAASPHLAANRWGGQGFLSFCKANLPPEITVIQSMSGGYLLDPARHGTDNIQELTGESDGVVARVCRLTGAPPLSSAQFRTLFEALAAELSTNDFSLTVTGRNVRDATAERGQPLGRNPINFILQGLAYQTRGGLGSVTWTPRALAQSWLDNLVELCGNAGLELSPEERQVIDSWILGGFESQASEASPSA